jgi:general secretion pathway protein C
MRRNTSPVWAPRLAALCVAGVLGASLVYWMLRWQASHSQPPRPAALSVVNRVNIDPNTLAQWMGATTSSPAAATPHTSASNRFQLIGVVAGGSGQGTALIAIDGQPAKAFRVGHNVAEEWVLQSVGGRRAVLAANAQASDSISLEMPVQPR